MNDIEKKLTNQEKLQLKADKLKEQLSQTQNRLAQIKAKHSAEDRKKRTSKLCETAGIFDMVSPELIETKSDTNLFRQILGLALSLNDLRKNVTSENQQKLAMLEHAARQFLENREPKDTQE
jgi:uncharacterized protein with GYD domain